jgi:hypothetical protein
MAVEMQKAFDFEAEKLLIDDRIGAGERYLEKTYGEDWDFDINLNTFNIFSGILCLLAQKENATYDLATQKLGLSDSDAAGYGFTIPYALPLQWAAEYADILTAAWKRIIRRKREEKYESHLDDLREEADAFSSEELLPA